MHGRPSMAGNFNFRLLGAFAPTDGGSATGFGGGGGVCHDEKALPHCTFAKGLDMPPNPPSAPSAPFAPREVGSLAGHEGSVTPLRPALRRAILVPSLLSMALVGGAVQRAQRKRWESDRRRATDERDEGDVGVGNWGDRTS